MHGRGKRNNEEQGGQDDCHDIEVQAGIPHGSEKNRLCGSYEDKRRDNLPHPPQDCSEEDHGNDSQGRDESCGQCSPCREGTGWVYRILTRIVAGQGNLRDLDNLADICAFMGGTTICALADGAAMPLRSYPQKFRPEFEDYINQGKSNPEAVRVLKSMQGAARRGGQREVMV